MKKMVAGMICALTAINVSAADFFSTEKCDELLTFGARIGVNTSNRTIKDSAFPDCYHHESWGTGFDVGVVANLNIRDYIAIQPGVFFESLTGEYALMGTRNGSVLPDDGSEIGQVGHRRSYNLTIPVMAVLRFNVADNVRWNVEAGPYVSFVLDSSLKNERFVVNGTSTEPLFSQAPASVDFGFKMGTAFELFDHYYVGAHYLAGCLPAWQDRKVENITKTYGGLTKTWVFSIGYNF